MIWTPSPAPASPTASIELAGPSSAEGEAGTPLEITATFSKRFQGTQARLQFQAPPADGEKARWAVLKRIRVDSTRTATFSVRLAGAGVNRWRITSAKIDGRYFRSNVVKATSFAWFHLSALLPVARSKNWDESIDSVAMGGRQFPDTVGSLFSAGSYGGWPTGSADYNLSYRCTTFAATIGINDEAGSAASWDFITGLDGAETDQGWVSLARPKSLEVDVTGVFRLSLRNVRLDGDPWQDYEADALWGSARLLCSGTP